MKVIDVSRDVGKWRGIKDLGYVLHGIPKLSAKRRKGERRKDRKGRRRRQEWGKSRGEEKANSIMAPNRVPY